jgi:hypothetical protein
MLGIQELHIMKAMKEVSFIKRLEWICYDCRSLRVELADISVVGCTDEVIIMASVVLIPTNWYG